MTREIKFRSWDEEKKRMWIEDEMGYIMLDDIASGKIKNLMQFTGLKDKNGKEIYEGDIIMFDNIRDEESESGEVYFEDGVFKVKAEKLFTPILMSNNEVCYHDSWNIIGNKFENPELLK